MKVYEWLPASLQIAVDVLQASQKGLQTNFCKNILSSSYELILLRMEDPILYKKRVSKFSKS